MSTQSIERRQPACRCVSPYPIASCQSVSSFYAIVSDSEKAMFIDCGSASTPQIPRVCGSHGSYGSIRFVEHTIGDREDRWMRVTAGFDSVLRDSAASGVPAARKKSRRGVLNTAI